MSKNNKTDEVLSYLLFEKIDNNRKGKASIELFNLNEYSLVVERKAEVLQVKSMYKQFSLIEIIGKFESFIRVIYFELITTTLR